MYYRTLGHGPETCEKPLRRESLRVYRGGVQWILLWIRFEKWSQKRTV